MAVISERRHAAYFWPQSQWYRDAAEAKREPTMRGLRKRQGRPHECHPLGKATRPTSALRQRRPLRWPPRMTNRRLCWTGRNRLRPPPHRVLWLPSRVRTTRGGAPQTSVLASRRIEMRRDSVTTAPFRTSQGRRGIS